MRDPRDLGPAEIRRTGPESISVRGTSPHWPGGRPSEYRSTSRILQQKVQQTYEQTHSHAEWMQEIERNYDIKTI